MTVSGNGIETAASSNALLSWPSRKKLETVTSDAVFGSRAKQAEEHQQTIAVQSVSAPHVIHCSAVRDMAGNTSPRTSMVSLTSTFATQAENQVAFDSVCLSLQLAAVDTIRRACALLQVGDLIETEAVLYLQCALERPAFKTLNAECVAPVAAICLYLAIRMHQLPVSVQRLLLAVGQQAQFSVKLFWQVAKAVNQNPRAVDYTKFAVLVMADLHDEKASTKMQVSHAYLHFDHLTMCSVLRLSVIAHAWIPFQCCCVLSVCAQLYFGNAVNALAILSQAE